MTDVAADVPENQADYPQPTGIKALYGTPEDIQILGLHQSPCNINLPAMMTFQPAADDIPYEHDGCTYHFRRSAVEALDNTMTSAAEQGVLITMILLNSPSVIRARTANMAALPERSSATRWTANTSGATPVR